MKMVSKTCIQMMGFNVNVFGLEEYKTLSPNTPVSVIFGLHGKNNDQSQLEKSCQTLCGLNQKRRPQDRYIIAASFDGPNHGSRKIYPDEMVSKKSTTKEMHTFGMTIYVYPVEVSRTIVQLMDVFELYAFGPHHRHPVEKWGAMAFSLGAHSIFMAIANDPRITTFISVAGTPNFIGLIRQFYICLKQEKDLDQRTGFYNWAKSHRNDIFKKLNHVNLLAMYGSKDQVVKSVVGDYLTAILRKTQSGKENQDWKVLPMPELDHYISKECNVEAVQWTDRWMVRREMEVTAKL